MKIQNESPFGWWVATLIERYEYDNEDTSNPNRECKCWSNVVMFKAETGEEAFLKAMEYGNLGKLDQSEFIDEETGKKGKYVFEGLASLLPVYDELDEDGTEILYDENFTTVADVQSRIRKKEELEIFQD